jgi:hypothetical protein
MSFDPASITANVIFGLIGTAAFIYGKNTVRIPYMLIGIVLMIYPFFISQIWLLYAIGITLCIGLYFFRD